MVEPAGRYARRPLSSVGPSTFQLDADHSSLSGLRGDRLFPAVAAAPGSRALTGSAPRIPAGSVSGPEDRPQSDRPANTQNDAGRSHRTTSMLGYVRKRRYHRTVQRRTAPRATIDMGSRYPIEALKHLLIFLKQQRLICECRCSVTL
jgi:hypothetical protein